MYGRGAAALAAEINQQVDDPVTKEDTQNIIDGVASDFPVAWKWLNDNANFAVEHGYVENVFGRCRYFPGSRELGKRDQAAIRREAKNSPIQGLVADLLAQAGYNLYRLLRRTDVGRSLGIRILLPVHDAFLFEIRVPDLPRALPALRMCMSELNCLPGTQNRLDVDIEVFPHSWGDKAIDGRKKGPVKALVEKLTGQEAV